MAGGRRSGRERKAHGCSPRAGEAIALARGLCSQPRVPVSVIQTPLAATASRNLRRVISVLNPWPLPLCRVHPYHIIPKGLTSRVTVVTLHRVVLFTGLVEIVWIPRPSRVTIVPARRSR